MAKKNVIFDREKLRFRRDKKRWKKVLGRIGGYLLAAIPLSFVLFAIFSIFITTDEDRRLKAENAAYSSHYDELVEGQRLLREEVDYLTLRDGNIYRSLFYNDAPSPSLSGEVDFLKVTDTIPDAGLLKYTAGRLDRAEKTAGRVEENFEAITDLLGKGSAVPPMSLPIKDLSLAQIGASSGEKINPFFKVPLPHQGIDFIVLQGTDIFAAASGTVTAVSTDRKGLGNYVEIEHQGGYRTRYVHLSEISVKPGQAVSRGDRIGASGISGNSFAPHLHYEVIRDSLSLEPTAFFFADLSPTAYSNLLYMAERTGQSLD